MKPSREAWQFPKKVADPPNVALEEMKSEPGRYLDVVKNVAAASKIIALKCVISPKKVNSAQPPHGLRFVHNAEGLKN